MKNEIWKSIKGYEGSYSVSNKGRVKSEARYVKWGIGRKFIPERILTPICHKNGYYFVGLKLNNKQHIYSIHRLVAASFINEYSDDKQVHHLNEDKSDNRLENLKVLSADEHNNLHKQIYSITKICVICGKEYTPEATNRKKSQVCSVFCKNILLKKCAAKRKKPIVQLNIDGSFVRFWDSARDCQNETGFLEDKIISCCKHNRNKHKGYRWEYKENYKCNEK